MACHPCGQLRIKQVTEPRELVHGDESCSLVVTGGSVAGLGLVAQGAVAVVVVVVIPAADDHAGLGQ